MNNKIKYLTLMYIGFTSYIAIEVLFRGYSYPLMGVVGAICFLMLDKINEILPWNIDLFIQGCIGSFIVTMFELIIGLFFKYSNITPMWDYSELWGNFQGVICPLFSFLWIWLSIIAILFADSINYYFIKNGCRPKYTFFGLFHFKFPKSKNK